MTSPDGVNWTRRPIDREKYWYSITWSPELGLFCATSGFGPGNRSMFSEDGINWTFENVPYEDSHDWMSVCWSPELGIFCAVADSGLTGQTMTSSGPLTWTNEGDAMVADLGAGVTTSWSVPVLSTLNYIKVLSGDNETYPCYITSIAKTALVADQYLISNGTEECSEVNKVKRLTDCAATGALIVSAIGGATRSWTSVDAGFNPNRACTYKIYRVR